MKWLKYLPLLFLLLPGLFFLVGILTPRFAYECEIEAAASIDQCWDTFTDVEKMDQWVVGFQDMILIEGDSNQAGSRYEMLIDNGGGKSQMIEEILVSDAPERFVFLIDNDAMISKVKVNFSTTPTGTRMKATHEVEGKNIFWRSFFPLMKGQFQRQSQASYEKLQTVMEAGE